MAFQVHDLQCGSFCPASLRLLSPVQCFCCRCLAVETNEGLVLVDTGLHPDVSKASYGRLWSLTGAEIEVGQTAKSCLEEKGFRAEDVQHIILTHLDSDHCGALIDFPHATAHLHQKEWDLGQNSGAQFFGLKNRYDQKIWASHKKWKFYSEFGDTWNSFAAIQQLEGLPPEILMVPLLGHTLGHSGVAIHSNKGWILHAGDSFFLKEDLETSLSRFHISSQLFQNSIAMDNRRRLSNQKKLETLLLQKSPPIQITNSHDPRLSIL